MKKINGQCIASSRNKDFSSKYGANPSQFDIDVENNRLKKEAFKAKAKSDLMALIANSTNGSENLSVIIECLKEIKTELSL